MGRPTQLPPAPNNAANASWSTRCRSQNATARPGSRYPLTTLPRHRPSGNAGYSALRTSQPLVRCAHPASRARAASPRPVRLPSKPAVPNADYGALARASGGGAEGCWEAPSSRRSRTRHCAGIGDWYRTEQGSTGGRTTCRPSQGRLNSDPPWRRATPIGLTQLGAGDRSASDEPIESFRQAQR